MYNCTYIRALEYGAPVDLYICQLLYYVIRVLERATVRAVVRQAMTSEVRPHRTPSRPSGTGTLTAS